MIRKGAENIYKTKTFQYQHNTCGM